MTISRSSGASSCATARTTFASTCPSLPKKADVDLREIVLVQLNAQQAKPAGTLDGSPVTMADTYFFAFEHPLSKIRTLDSELQCSLPRSTPLKVGDEQTYSSVMGVAPPGQLRRAFLYYVERERAQPYRPFLHYNSWYDLGYGLGKILEPDALKVIDLFGKELIEQRKVVMDSFVPDDGWDDPASLWRFHEGFPNGFATLQQAAQRYNAGVGAWLSPWGGYGKAKEERMKYGLKEGFETNKNGFSMAGPKYYARFRDACLGMVRDYDLNYFKFDGISSGGAPTGAPAEFAADVEALLRLIGDLRAGQTRPLHQRHDRHVVLALLALVRGLDLALRQRLEHLRLGLEAAAAGHLPRCPDLSERRAPGAAVPDQFADDPGRHVRQPRPSERHGPHRRGHPRLLRQRHELPGVVPDAVAAGCQDLGRPGRGGDLVPQQRRRARGHPLDRRRPGQRRGLRLGLLVQAQRHSRPAQSEGRAGPDHASTSAKPSSCRREPPDSTH